MQSIEETGSNAPTLQYSEAAAAPALSAADPTRARALREFLLSMNISPEKICSRDTALVVEALPRSGSSFLVGALNDLNHRKLKLSHHTHRLENLLIADLLEIPQVVLVREPVSAITALTISNPKPIAYWAQRYAAFYETVTQLRGQFLLLRFEDLIGDPAFAIRQIAAFAPGAPFKGSLSNAVAAAQERAEERDRRSRAGPEGLSNEEAGAAYQRSKAVVAEEVREFLADQPAASDAYQSLTGAGDLQSRAA